MASQAGDYIQVAARFRPTLAQDGVAGEAGEAGCASAWTVDADKGCVVVSDVVKGSKELAFDHVLDAHDSNEVVYSTVARRVVDNVLDGFNGTVLAYGQTGSGKTFTMSGDASQRGVLQFAIEDMFERLQQRQEQSLVRVSYMEVYNEKIFDLLQEEEGDPKPLKIIRDDPVLGVIVQDLREVVVRSSGNIMNELAKGENLRHYRATDMNGRSSRSHTVFRLVVESKQTSEDEQDVDNARPRGVTVACLTLVDLAGSERQSHARTSGVSLKEGGNINRSLLALREVISGLSASAASVTAAAAPTSLATTSQVANARTHISYRNSKLTRILRQALGGNAVTCLICTVSPCRDHEQDSINTLQFGVMCKGVRNAAVRNEIASEDALIQTYRKQLAKLQASLGEQRNHTHKIQAELERKTVELSGDNVHVEEKEPMDVATKYALRAQQWWRKAELERLQALRLESEANQEKARKLEDELRSLQSAAVTFTGKRTQSGGLAYVMHCHNTASRVMQFAQRKRDHKGPQADPGDVEEQLRAALQRVQQLEERCHELERGGVFPTGRIEELKSWESDMKAWHEESVLYNQETDERAQLVEQEAVKVDLKRQQLASYEAQLEQLAKDREAEIVSQANGMAEQLQQLQEEVEDKWEKLRIAESRAEKQTQIETNERHELHEELSAFATRLEEKARRVEAREEELEERERVLEQREAEAEAAHAALTPDNSNGVLKAKLLSGECEALRSLVTEIRRKVESSVEGPGDEFEEGIKDIAGMLERFETVHSFLEECSTIVTPLNGIEEALPMEMDSVGQETLPREFFEELARTLGEILTVAVPILAAPGQHADKSKVAHQQLRFKQKLLSRQLSQAKILLLSSINKEHRHATP